MIPDLINPLDGLLGKAFHGHMHEFAFSRGEFTGAHVEKILRHYGIRVWGRRKIDGNTLALSVKMRQAVWAEHVLLKAGVPITSQLLDPRNERYANRPGATLPKAWGKGIGPKSVIDHVVVWLEKFLG